VSGVFTRGFVSFGFVRFILFKDLVSLVVSKGVFILFALLIESAIRLAFSSSSSIFL
jgi:hypothetical protein